MTSAFYQIAKWGLTLLMVVNVSSVYAETAHLEQTRHIPHFVAKYRLIDIGETELDPSRMSKQSQKLTLSPAINNFGQGIGNRIKGGFIFLPSRWEYAPYVSGMKINIHAINHKGDLLVALDRGSDSVEWMIWPWKEEGYGGARKHVQTIDPFKSDFYVTGFNDNGSIVGYVRNEGKNQPIIWTAEQGVQDLGKQKGLQIKGIARTINNKNSVAGISEEPTDRRPFLWNDQTGLEVLRKYRNYLEPKGWVEFADMVLTDDDTIYGTYWIRHLSEGNAPHQNNPYYAYTWKPSKGEVRMIDLEGMRISGANNSHIIVGSLDGQAAVREPGRKPIELIALMDPEKTQGWELIEATSINDKGQIVGYGKYQDKLHIFLANPLP